MIQKEVGQKIITDTTKRSPLRWYVNYAYHVRYVRNVPPSSFTPPPKVDSRVLALDRKTKIPNIPVTRLTTLIHHISPYPRKTLAKIAKIIAKQ